MADFKALSALYTEAQGRIADLEARLAEMTTAAKAHLNNACEMRNRWVEVCNELTLSQAREKRLREALEAIANNDFFEYKVIKIGEGYGRFIQAARAALADEGGGGAECLRCGTRGDNPHCPDRAPIEEPTDAE